MADTKYVPTIGLEIHAELKTERKMFCDSLNNPYEKEPNVNVCPVCMGHPGTLPVPNKEAIEQVMRVGFALGAEVAVDTKFDRKNYFYPDLPKGYQISQYDQPIVSGGSIEVVTKGDPSSASPTHKASDEHRKASEGQVDSFNKKRIDIERVHLEEDTARMQHAEDGKSSLIDYNRSSIPLMELVTKPVIESAEQARLFAEALQQILRYLGASDAEPESGTMRVEHNISIAPEGAKEFGTKVEIKNLNSFSALQGAAAFEIARQKELLEKGEAVVQETRGWDEVEKRTFSQRVKEGAADYRYFPEPDIPPLVLNKENGFDRDALAASIPELPQAKRARFIKEYGHDDQTVSVFIANKELADYYEQVISEFLAWDGDPPSHKASEGQGIDKSDLIRLATNYVVKNIRTLLDEEGMKLFDIKATPENFAEFIYLVQKGEIGSAATREVLLEMAKTGADPSDIIEGKGLKQESGADAIGAFADEVIAGNKSAVADYKKGKEAAIKFLVGQLMAKSRGAANPQVAEEVLKEKLK
ncbi:MAG: Asp-tRNA(Asn)/Glu-tRNA(Gln) amidotransferase subunit GatB [Candidatus Spechtbacterales bacterium]